jgi:hypothetical protein
MSDDSDRDRDRDRNPDPDRDRKRDADAGAGEGESEGERAGDGESEGERAAGTFLVTAVDEGSAVLLDVDGGRVHTLSENPDLERHDAVRGVLAADAMGVTWSLVEERERWTVSMGESDESPTTMARELAAEQDVGELTRRERAGEGELHVITVPADRTADAVADVLADTEGVLARVARLGVARAEVRSEPGVVVVRYLP